VKHPGVDKVSFTGSTAAGRAVAAACAPDLRRVSLELGGKSAAIVLADADPATVAKGVRSASLSNSGQICNALTRILVPANRADDFIDALAAEMTSMVVGDPTNSATHVGPLVAQRQQQRVRGYIESGAGAPDVPEVDAWWRKNRVGVQGTNGFAEALTGGGWRAVTTTGSSSGGGSMNYDLDMPPYVADMAAWLDDDKKVHPCDGEQAFKGIEITMALMRSVVERGQVKLPLGPGAPEVEALKNAMPDKPV